MSVLPLLAAALILFAVISLAYVVSKNLLNNSPNSGGQTTAEQPGAAPSQAAQAPGQAASSAPASVSGNPQQNAAQVDKSQPLDFYNATTPSVQGLSRSVSEKFKQKGWTIGVVESWKGSDVAGKTTVFYGRQSQKATADAVVADLGRGSVEQTNSRVGKALAVVISNDYPH